MRDLSSFATVRVVLFPADMPSRTVMRPHPDPCNRFSYVIDYNHKDILIEFTCSAHASAIQKHSRNVFERLPLPCLFDPPYGRHCCYCAPGAPDEDLTAEEVQRLFPNEEDADEVADAAAEGEA